MLPKDIKTYNPYSKKKKIDQLIANNLEMEEMKEEKEKFEQIYQEKVRKEIQQREADLRRKIQQKKQELQSKFNLKSQKNLAVTEDSCAETTSEGSMSSSSNNIF